MRKRMYRLDSRFAWLVVLPWLMWAGCYSPSIEDCQFLCAQSSECPDDFVCRSGFCVHEGVNPSVCGATEADGGPADVISQEDIIEEADLQDVVAPEDGGPDGGDAVWMLQAV